MPWYFEEGKNYCEIRGEPIDYELVKIQAPACITKYRGCGNCPHCKYVLIQKVKKQGDPEEMRLLFDGGSVPYSGMMEEKNDTTN